MKQSCVNCAFCIHCQNKITLVESSIFQDKKEKLLTDDERKSAKENNFSFIGLAKRKQKEWLQRYYQNIDDLKKGKYNHIIGGPKVLEMLVQNDMASRLTPGHSNQYPLRDTFGMEPMPQAPDLDYLACWHDLWNFEKEPEKYSSINNKNKCLFFYPYTQKGNKSFEGCEKERQALLAQKRSFITNFLVIVGIIATVISILVAGCIYRWQHQDNEISRQILNTQLMNTTNKLNDVERISIQNQKDIQTMQTKEVVKKTR